MNTEITDDDIIRGCKDNDPASQRMLFNRFAPGMMSICLRYAKDEDEAKDVLQDGFIKVFEKLDQYSGSGSLGGWIRAVMVNTALIQIRKNKRFGIQEDINDHSDIGVEEFGVLEQMSADELMVLVQEMPQGYRTVFNLFAIEGYGHKEISKQLGISESTSKTQFLKAKQLLRKKLEAISNHE